MAEDVNQAIASYLKKIHDDFARPVILERSGKQYRPDRLVLFQEVLVHAYFRSASLFKRPAKADDDCGCSDSAKAKSAASSIHAMSIGMECQADEDCHENEKCIYGECVPIPFDVEFAPLNAQPSYGDEVTRAWEDYSARIYEVLVNGLAKNPRRLAAVRNELMRMYAAAAAAAGAPRTKCDETPCEEGKWCVDGICVPIPFRLVFKRATGARPDAWPRK